MALTLFAPNLAATSQNAALYLLIVQMVAAGWTPVDGSDGTTYGAGLVWNAPAVALNAGAWQRLEAGDGLRQIAIMVGNPATRDACIAYGPTAGSAPDVTPGGPTTFPGVVGGWLSIVGAGGPPTFTSQFCAPFPMRVAIGCASAAGAGDGAFYVVAAPQGGGIPWQFLLSYEPIAFPDPADPDPYVWRAYGFDGNSYQAADLSAGGVSTVSSQSGFRGQNPTFGNLPGLALYEVAYTYQGDLRLFPAAPATPGDRKGPGVNPYSARWDHAPIGIAGSRMAPAEGVGLAGWKGVSTLYRWVGASLGVGTPAVIELPGGGARVASGAVSLEWSDPAVPWNP